MADTDPTRAPNRPPDKRDVATGRDRPQPPPQQRFTDSITRKAARKSRARSGRDRGVAFWLGMFGMVGWAVAVPMLAGIWLGLWLDSARPESEASWTLTFLLIGVAVGVLNAWYWVKRESRGD